MQVFVDSHSFDGAPIVAFQWLPSRNLTAILTNEQLLIWRLWEQVASKPALQAKQISWNPDGNLIPLKLIIGIIKN